MGRRRLDGSLAGNCNLSDSARAERGVVGNFFGMRSPGVAFVEIILLWAAIPASIVLFWHISPFSDALLLPYLAGVTYAAYLNAGIWRLN